MKVTGVSELNSAQVKVYPPAYKITAFARKLEKKDGPSGKSGKFTLRKILRKFKKIN